MRFLEVISRVWFSPESDIQEAAVAIPGKKLLNPWLYIEVSRGNNEMDGHISQYYIQDKMTSVNWRAPLACTARVRNSSSSRITFLTFLCCSEILTTSYTILCSGFRCVCYKYQLYEAQKVFLLRLSQRYWINCGFLKS